jgi:ATP-dependent DNA ligase
MLADKCDSPEEFLEKVTFPCHGDWKYDGQRTIAIVRVGYPVEYRARSGKPMDHLIGTYDEDLGYISDHLGYDFVIDGESFASDFTETINAKKEGNQAAKDALRLRAFFLMPLTDWIAQKTDITMSQNRKFLANLLKTTGATRIEISAGREVKDYADMVAYCNEVIDVHKQEGLILKNWDSVYQWDRSMDWCKVKRMWDVDARVVAWYPGKPKSRLQNTCGGITVEGRDEHGREFRCNVGSGFSDEARDDIAKNFDAKYKHQTAVITYQEISKAKDAEFFSLRFPVYNHIRDDKIVEPIGE